MRPAKGLRPATASLAASAVLAVVALAPDTGAGSSRGERGRPALDRALSAIGVDAGSLRARPAVPVPGGGAIHRFRQRAGGLPVLGAEVIVADPAGAPARVVADTTAAIPVAQRSRPAVGRARAIRIARRAQNAALLRGPAAATLGVDPGSGARAWEVRLPAARPIADWVVRVHAVSGRVLRARDLLRRATATATLFDPNPVVTQGSYSGLKDNRDRDSAQLAALRRPVVLERLTSEDGCLHGQFVDVRLGRKAKPVCKRSLDFTAVDRHSEAFEALMGYFHTDRTRAYVESLALTKNLRAKPQRVRANGIADDNSYYSPFQRSITLGTGGVDDGEDADVIVHEYGHSIQDQAVRFFGDSLEGAAIGEGFGDYLAAVMSSRVTGGNPRYDPCMFEWDAVSYTKNRCARRTDRSLTKPRANRRCQREPHCVGEAWAGALWELRALLGTDAAGQAVMDRVTLQSNFMLARESGFRDAARALLAADEMLYAGAHVAAIEAEMAERRFCKPSRC